MTARARMTRIESSALMHPHNTPPSPLVTVPLTQLISTFVCFSTTPSSADVMNGSPLRTGLATFLKKSIVSRPNPNVDGRDETSRQQRVESRPGEEMGDDKRARAGSERETRCNAVMRVTKNMRPSTDSLIMGAAINKPAELGRSVGRRVGCRQRRPEEGELHRKGCCTEQILPFCIVNLHRGSIGSTTNKEEDRGRSSFFLELQTRYTACKSNAELREEGRKEGSERSLL